MKNKYFLSFFDKNIIRNEKQAFAIVVACVCADE